MDLSPSGRQAVRAGLRQIDRLTGELDPLRRQPGMLSRRQPGCAALRATQFGVGGVTSVAIWAELGDVRRFGNSDDVVRHTGLDITVHSSDAKRLWSDTDAAFGAAVRCGSASPRRSRRFER
jgi:transposase